MARALSIGGMRVEMAGNVLPVHIRLAHKIKPGDFIVLDEENNVLSDTHPTFQDAAMELYQLNNIEVINGLPVYSKTQAQFSRDPCLVTDSAGMHFIHDNERRDRLRAVA